MTLVTELGPNPKDTLSPSAVRFDLLRRGVCSHLPFWVSKNIFTFCLCSALTRQHVLLCRDLQPQCLLREGGSLPLLPAFRRWPQFVADIGIIFIVVFKPYEHESGEAGG